MSPPSSDTRPPLLEAKLRLDALEGVLKYEYTPEVARPDPVFKVDLYVEAIGHRIHDLSSEAYTLYGSGAAVPAVVLTRAAVESAAMMYWVLRKLRGYRDTRNDEALESDLLSLLFGRRGDEVVYKIPNVLSGLDRLDKEFAGVRQTYDALSEYAHPNGSGVLMSYAKPNSSTHFVFGRRAGLSVEEFGIRALSLALGVTIHVHQEVERTIRELEDFV